MIIPSIAKQINTMVINMAWVLLSPGFTGVTSACSPLLFNFPNGKEKRNSLFCNFMKVALGQKNDGLFLLFILVIKYAAWRLYAAWCLLPYGLPVQMQIHRYCSLCFGNNGAGFEPEKGSIFQKRSDFGFQRDGRGIKKGGGVFFIIPVFISLICIQLGRVNECIMEGLGS